MSKENLKFLGKQFLKGAAIGVLIGFGLSFTALSPLVIGGIIGFLPITALYIKDFLGDKVAKDKKSLVIVGASLTIVAAVGVALGAAASSLLSGVMLSTWSSVLAGTIAGAVIGTIGVVLARPTAEYIVEPVVEKIAKCFSKEAPV